MRVTIVSNHVFLCFLFVDYEVESSFMWAIECRCIRKSSKIEILFFAQLSEHSFDIILLSKQKSFANITLSLKNDFSITFWFYILMSILLLLLWSAEAIFFLNGFRKAKGRTSSEGCTSVNCQECKSWRKRITFSKCISGR